MVQRQLGLVISTAETRRVCLHEGSFLSLPHSASCQVLPQWKPKCLGWLVEDTFLRIIRVSCSLYFPYSVLERSWLLKSTSVVMVEIQVVGGICFSHPLSEKPWVRPNFPAAYKA